MSWHKRKEHVCTYCRRSFKKERQVVNHMRDSHPKELQKYQTTVVERTLQEVLDEEQKNS